MSSQHSLLGGIVTALSFIFILSLSVSAPIGCGPRAQAQTESSERTQSDSGRETRRVEAYSRRGVAVLQEAQNAIENEAYDLAVKALDQILSNPSKFKAVDVAAAYRMRGHAHVQAEQLDAALNDFERAIANPSLPDWDVLDLQFNMAQIYLAQDDVNDAIAMLEQWFARAQSPNAAAYFFAARAYAQGERWSDAESNVALGLAKMDPADPKEEWYRISTVVYFQAQRYTDAKPLLESMVSFWPAKKEYYMQLSAVYSELGMEQDAFAMLAMAYDNNLALSSGELIRLGQLYRMYEYPYRGAKIIEKGLNDGTLKRSRKTCEEMGNAYFQAREMKSAMDPLECAAKAAEDGIIWLRLCQVHMQQEDWGRAESACRDALAKGGLQNQIGFGEQLLGIIVYEQGKREEAVEWFNSCMAYEDSADFCLKRKSFTQAELTRERLEQERSAAAAQAEAKYRQDIDDQIRQMEHDARSLRSGKSVKAMGAD